MTDILKSIEKIVAANKELVAEVSVKRDQIDELQRQINDLRKTYQSIHTVLSNTRSELATEVSKRDDALTERINQIAKLEVANQFLGSENERLKIAAGTTKKVSKRVHNEFIMARRLRQMGINYETISPIFYVPDTVLSGGLVVQTMLGEFWQTDLDIFTTDAKTVIAILKETHPYWIHDIAELSTHMAENYSTEYKARVWRGEIVKGVIVEIIQVQNIDTCMKGFDLDFCKCYFDGRNFHAYNVEALMTKTHKGRHTIKKNRTYKYEMRGFLILQPLIDDSMPPLLESDSDDESLEHDIPGLEEVPNPHSQEHMINRNFANTIIEGIQKQANIKFTPTPEQIRGLMQASALLAKAAQGKNDNIESSQTDQDWCEECETYH